MQNAKDGWQPAEAQSSSKEGLSLEPLEEHGPADTLISHLYPSDSESTFLLF
jgi:hypothetical protein